VRPPAKSVAGLARFLVPYRARIAAAALALVVAAGCVLALGQGVKHVVDNGFGSGDARLLDRALAAMVAVAAVLAGLRAWSRNVALAGAALLLATWFVISIAGLDTILRFYGT